MPFLQILLAASGDNALGHQETLRNESYQDISPSVCRWCFSLLVSASLLGYEKGGAWVQPIPAGYRDSARSWEAWEQRGRLPIAGLRRHRGMRGVFGRRMEGSMRNESQVGLHQMVWFLRKSIFSLLPLMLVLKVKALGWRWRHHSGNVLLQTVWLQREFLLLAWY